MGQCDLCGGFCLSTRDLSKFIVYPAHTETLLNNTEKAIMDENLQGRVNFIAVKNGKACVHDGIVTPGIVTPGEAGPQTMIIKFPNSIGPALSASSPGNNC
jgi:hypothetical protein